MQLYRKGGRHFVRIGLQISKGGLLLPYLVMTLDQEGLLTKPPIKHAGLLWLPAENFITTLCAFKTLNCWKAEAPLARDGKGKVGVASGCQTTSHYNKPGETPSKLAEQAVLGAVSGTRRIRIVSITETSCQ